MDECNLASTRRRAQHAFAADGLRPTQCVGHESSCLNECECEAAFPNGILATCVPRTGADSCSHVQRRELDHVSHASSEGGEGDRPISFFEIRSIRHEEYPVGPGQRSS